MNDAGKVAFTPKGDYSSTVTYEYLDTVVYDGNAYAALKTTTGNQPEDDSEYWALLARGGTSIPTATEDTQGAVKASDDIGVDSDAHMVLKTDFTEQTNLTEIQSGETRKTFFGKIAKAVSDLISHISASATADKVGHVKLSSSSAVTDSTGLALPATEKNATIDGTLANKLENHTHDDRYYTEKEINDKLAQKSKVTVSPQTLTGNGSNWILVSNSGKKLIAAQTVRDDTRFGIKAINKQSATGLYTLIFDETVEKDSKILVWLTWID